MDHTCSRIAFAKNCWYEYLSACLLHSSLVDSFRSLDATRLLRLRLFKQMFRVCTYKMLSLSLSLSHTHTHTHTLSLSLSLSLFLCVFSEAQTIPNDHIRLNGPGCQGLEFDQSRFNGPGCQDLEFDQCFAGMAASIKGASQPFAPRTASRNSSTLSSVSSSCTPSH